MSPHCCDPNLHLLFNPETLHQVGNVVLVPGKLNRRRDPVVIADRPWEGKMVKIGSGCGSVLFDEKINKFRMWYLPINTTIPYDRPKPSACYAESSDAVHWEKPDLGLCEFNGSKNNNICVSPEIVPGVPYLQCLLVIEDEWTPDPNARYKGLIFGQDPRMYQVFFPEFSDDQRAEFAKAAGHYWLQSPDGIRWQYTGRRMTLPGDRFCFGRDRLRNEWLVQCCGHADPISFFHNGIPYTPRRIALRRSTDLEHFGPMEHPFFLGEHEQYGMRRDHHTFHPFTYGNMLLGLLDLSVLPSHGPEVEIVTSLDGRRWNRPLQGIDFLPDGPIGEWDEENACFASSDPIRVGDELFFFYSGSTPVRTYGDMNMYRKRHEIPPEELGACSIGLATLPLDAFAGWRTFGRFRGHEGFVTTRPITLTAPNLQANFHNLGGYLRAEICSENLDLIPGLTAENCEKITRSGPRQPLRFTNGKNLKELLDKKVSIRFLFNNGTLFSFRFAE